MPENGAPLSPEGSSLPDKKLVSWKEIATYLGREVRTVQRWENTEGLPVHRHEHLKKSTVYAYASELDEWFRKRQPKDDPVADAAFVPEPEILEPGDNEDTDAPVNEPLFMRWRAIAAAVVVIVVGSYVAYRLIYPVNSGESKVRLVVLPFENLSGDQTKEYVSAGLTDGVTTELGRLDPPHLGVIAPTSGKIVAKKTIPEIRDALNVKYVLEGSVQSVANQIRIDVRLIDTADATSEWTRSFTRELPEILQAESDVADAVAHHMLVTLPVSSSAEPSGAHPSQVEAATRADVAQARDAYLKGKFAWAGRGDLGSSIKFFEQAIQLDPYFAQAYSGLAGAESLFGQVPNEGMPPREAKPRAREAAQKALKLDSRLSEAHAVLGNVTMSYDWDLETAEKELNRAIQLNFNDPTAHEWYAHLLMVEGRNDEAMAEANRMLQLSPADPLFNAVRAECLYYGRKYDQAIEEAQNIVKLHPDFPYAHYWLGSAFREKKMYAEAIATFERARQASHDTPFLVMAYGHAQAVAGNAAEARKALRMLEDAQKTKYVPDLYLAAIHVGLGEKDEAFRLLNSAYQQRVDRLIYLKVEPMADPLRSDPRFQELLDKIGLR